MEAGLATSRILLFKHLTFISPITLPASKKSKKPLHSSPPSTSSQTSSFAQSNLTSTKTKIKNCESYSRKSTWDFRPASTFPSRKVTNYQYRLEFLLQHSKYCRGGDQDIFNKDQSSLLHLPRSLQSHRSFPWRDAGCLLSKDQKADDSETHLSAWRTTEKRWIGEDRT